MRILRLHILLWLFVAAAGCNDKTIVPIEDQAPTGQVVKLIVEPNALVTAYCSRTVGITQPFLLETGVRVLIKTKSSSSWESFGFNSPGMYNWNCRLKPKDSFALRYIGALDSFEIQEMIPSSIVIKSVDTSTNIVPGIGKTQVFTLKFRDSAIYKNYYQIYLKRNYRKYNFIQGNTSPVDSQLLTEIMRIDGNELPFIRNAYNNYTDKSILFTDEIFNGVSVEFQCHNLKPWQNTKLEKTLSVEIHLENLTEDVYHYYNTEASHLWQKQSITQLPNPLFSNIPGGFGVIGAKTSDKVIVQYSK